VIALALILGLTAFSGVARAASPQRIAYQGQIFDADGTPREGSATLQVGILDAPTEGTLLYEEVHAAVPLRGGVFDLELGAGVVTAGGSFSLLTEDVFAGPERHLEVRIDGELMTPRQRIGSGAYAFQCEVSEMAGTATFADVAGDADTLDGRQATELDQSGALAAHETDPSAHHPDVLGALSCVSGQLPKWNGSSWLCGSDLDTSAATECGAGELLSGGGTCEPISQGDITAVIPGAGLLGGGDAGAVSLSVDTAEVQRRISRHCSVGSSIRLINTDGTVACQTDHDTTYSAGSGLALAGTTFSVDTSAVQRRVLGQCPAGSSIRAIGSAGTVACETDNDSGGDITGISTSGNSGLQGGVSSGTANLRVDPTDFNGVAPVRSSYNVPIQTVHGGSPSGAGSPYSTLSSVTITAPVPGRVLLIGTTTAKCESCASTSVAYGWLGWDTDQTGISQYLSNVSFRGTNPSYQNTTSTAVYSVDAGTHSFFFRANCGNGSLCRIGFMYKNATALFIPN
jgi:hypothetical protein